MYGAELVNAKLGVFQRIARTVLLGVMCFAGGAQAVEKIIIDTDMGGDVDDVGAVAVANYYMGQGRAELLAVMVSNIGSQGGWAAAASDAVNTYYKHPNIKLGTNRGPATAIAGDGSEFTRHIGSNASRYGHDHNQFDQAEDAVLAYRRLLSSQPDRSVNLVVVGWMSNIANLMDSASNHRGDGIHSTGKQLLERKLKRLVVMGGRYPSGLEFNFKLDGPSASRVIAQLQVPMVFSGYELGTLVQTGSSLVQTSSNNPVREAYRLYGGGVEPFNRSSWDLTAVLYVVEGLGDYFNLSASGKNQVNGDGSNSWLSGNSKGDYYLKLKDSQARYRLQDRLNYILAAAPTSGPKPPVCAVVLSLAALNPSCSTSNGSIESTVSGGVAPYQYAWSDGSSQSHASALGPGSYSLAVSDAKGCTASASTALASLSLTTNIQHASDTHLGSISLSPSGGRAPLSFDWSNGATQRDIHDLAAGQYSVAVSDAAGCIVNKSLEVELLAASPEHYLEAECAVETGASWFEANDSSASGQLLLATDGGTYNLGPSGSAASTLRYELKLESSGDYRLYARVSAADEGQDSLWYRINSGDWVAWHMGSTASLSWVRLSTAVAFQSGSNVLEIAFREGGLELDKLYVTQGTVRPVGAVGEASNCGPVSCPVAGTSCDDGNALTVNDRTDGDCGCAGTPVTGQSHALDAECASDIGDNWQAFTSSDAAKGSAIRVAANQYNLTPTAASATRVSFSFEHLVADDLQLFARINAPDNGSDSVWIRVNGGEWQDWHFGSTAGFSWHRWWLSVAVEAGSNVVDFAFREGGLELDKIFLSKSAALPISYGDDSSNCGPGSCPAAGLACDDGNDNTYEDVTDGNCNCTGVPFGVELVALEAECAADQGGLWQEDSSALASEQGYVAVPLGNYNMHQNGNAETELSFPVALGVAGDYYLYAHTLTPDAGSDSLWYQIDEGAWNAWHLGVSQQFNWQRHYQVLPLSAGAHTVRIAFREGGLQLDKLVLSQGLKDLAGTGPEASNCN